MCEVPIGEATIPFTESFADNANGWWSLLAPDAFINNGLFFRYPISGTTSNLWARASIYPQIKQEVPDTFTAVHTGSVIFEEPAGGDMPGVDERHSYTHDFNHVGIATRSIMGMSIRAVFSFANPWDTFIDIWGYSFGSGGDNKVTATLGVTNYPWGLPYNFELHCNNDRIWLMSGGSEVLGVNRDTRAVLDFCGSWDVEASSDVSRDSTLPLSQVYYECSQFDLNTTGRN